MKLLFVFGTRPEAIKLAPVLYAARRSTPMDVRVCVTGQHREMLDQALQFFRIRPDHNLAVMQPNQNLTSLMACILDGLRPVLLAEKPDMILVQGDTLTAFAAGLAAFFERIPVAHVEAGLRTYDPGSPFPEEALRQMITRLASLHFAPTRANVQALLKEGVPQQQIFLTGNPGIDAVLWTRDQLRRSSTNPLQQFAGPAALQQISNAEQVILVTGHRRENFGSGLQEVCLALCDIARQHPRITIAYPVHPNPNVRDQVQCLLEALPNIVLLPPLDYPACVYLMDLSSVIVTDSGGIQEEAPALGKPVLVTRATTERMEAIENGSAQLVGTNREAIVAAVNRLLPFTKKQKHSGFFIATPFGDGYAAEKIVRILQEQQSVQDYSASVSLPVLGQALLNGDPFAEEITSESQVLRLG